MFHISTYCLFLRIISLIRKITLCWTGQIFRVPATRIKNSKQLKQYRQNDLFRGALIFLLFFVFHGSTVASENVKKETKLNVLFVGIDDLNDWAISKMEGYEGANTPNLDKLAQQGLLFSNAHCAAPSCGPSRTSLMTGIRPSTSGNYNNGHDWRKNDYLKDVLTLPKYFMKHGYRSIGGGKIFHELEHCRGHNDLSSWDDFFPGGQKQMPKACHPKEKPNRGMVHFDWGATGKEVTEMSDQKVVNWAIGELDKKQDKPFFMAVGIYRPHLPWYVPQYFFDLYPEDKITIPYNKKNWRKGFPKELINMGGSRRVWDKHVLKTNRVKEAIQGYLACVSYADYELGRLMEALDNSAYKDNTVVVLWTDHGWHLGEKNAWAKFTLWEESTRIPLIIRSPSHNNEGKHCTRPVSLMDIYPTLLDLTGLPAYEKNEGQSLLPLINDPESLRSEPAITTLGRRNHSIRSEHFRYIHMANGSEGLFDHREDPGEWNNLADNKEYEEIKKSLKAHLPKINVPGQPDNPI